MSETRHSRLSSIFLEVCDLPAADVSAALDRACAGDTELRDAVASMLAADSDRNFLAGGVTFSIGDEPAPAQIGAYRILGLRGRGGTAVVYEAEQDRPRRRVALKILRRLWTTPELVRRLENEAQALARLQHPGIAAIYGVGTADGSPYLAMELVDGVPLTDFAAARALSSRDRVGLFAAVCDAVQHAHQRGIIHRDLKPSNILVGEGGAVKVVDFGVARLVDADESSSVHTMPGSVVGTLAYISPEQAAGDSARIDARTDVFSLGVVLFELLCGRLPIDTAGRPIAEALRAVCDDPPLKLGQIDRTLRGDLESVAAKCLAKDPDSRYGAVSELATDLRRFLAHETILARRAGPVYELRQFVRRRRGLVAAAAACAVVVVAAAAWAGSMNARVKLAESSVAETTGTMRDMLLELVRGVPAENRESVVGRAAEVLHSRRAFPHDPIAESDLHRAIGNIYAFEMQLPGAAVDAHRKALELYRQARPVLDEQSARMLVMLGGNLHDLGDHAGAAACLAEAIVYVRAHKTQGASDLTAVAQRLGEALTKLGRYNEAVAVFDEGIAHELKAHGPGTDLRADCLALRADALRRAGRLDEARASLLESIAACGAGENGAKRAIRPRRYLARLELEAGNPAIAEQIQRGVLDDSERLFTGESVEVLTAIIELSDTLRKIDRLADAESVLRRGIDIVRRNPGHNARTHWMVRERLVRVLSADPARKSEAELMNQEAESYRVRFQHPTRTAPTSSR